MYVPDVSDVLFVGVTRFARCNLALKSLMIVAKRCLLAFNVASFLPTLPFGLLKKMIVARSINIVFGTSLSFLVGQCCWTILMLQCHSATGISLWYVVSSVIFELFVFTASAGLSTNASSFGLKTVVSCTQFS